MRKQSGVSLVTLIITIIVIIILAGIVLVKAIESPETANFAVFRNDMELVEKSVMLTYIDLVGKYSKDGILLSDKEMFSEIATGNVNATTETVVFPDTELELIIVNDTHKIKNILDLPVYYDDEGNNQKFAIDPVDGSVYLIPGYKYKGEYYYSVDSNGASVPAYIE